MLHAIGDYAFATQQRAVTVPDHCVNCLRPHATVSMRVMPHIPPGFGPIIPLIDDRFRTKFFFRYCEACAAPIRRRRLIGTIVLSVAFTIIGVTLLAALAIGIFPKGHVPDFLWAIAYAGLASGTVIGLPAAFAGQSLRRTAPGVSIINDGSPTIVFHFTSRVYREHFAELNAAV